LSANHRALAANLWRTRIEKAKRALEAQVQQKEPGALRVNADGALHVELPEWPRLARREVELSSLKPASAAS